MTRPSPAPLAPTQRRSRDEHLPAPDLEALFCALVLAPETYSRNRFYELYQLPGALDVRRRARRVRSILVQLTEPYARPGRPIVAPPSVDALNEQEQPDGRVLVRYYVPQLELTRSTSLSQLELAALRYALHRAGRGGLSDSDRRRVEAALVRLLDVADAAPCGRTPDA